MRIADLEKALRDLPSGRAHEVPLETFFEIFGDARGIGPDGLQKARQFAEKADCVLVYDEFGQFNPVFRRNRD